MRPIKAFNQALDFIIANKPQQAKELLESGCSDEAVLAFNVGFMIGILDDDKYNAIRTPFTDLWVYDMNKWYAK